MDSLKKIGIIRCKQTSTLCSRSIDLVAAKNGTHGFAKSGPVNVIRIIDCGGCPGDSLGGRVDELIHCGAEGVALASCISGRNEFPFPCNNFPQIQTDIQERYGNIISLLECAH